MSTTRVNATHSLGDIGPLDPSMNYCTHNHQTLPLSGRSSIVYDAFLSLIVACLTEMATNHEQATQCMVHTPMIILDA